MVYFFPKKKGIIPIYHLVALYFYSLTCCEHPSVYKNNPGYPICEGSETPGKELGLGSGQLGFKSQVG